MVGSGTRRVCQAPADIEPKDTWWGERRYAVGANSNSVELWSIPCCDVRDPRPSRPHFRGTHYGRANEHTVDQVTARKPQGQMIFTQIPALCHPKQDNYCADQHPRPEGDGITGPNVTSTHAPQRPNSSENDGQGEAPERPLDTVPTQLKRYRATEFHIAKPQWSSGCLGCAPQQRNHERTRHHRTQHPLLGSTKAQLAKCSDCRHSPQRQGESVRQPVFPQINQRERNRDDGERDVRINQNTHPAELTRGKAQWVGVIPRGDYW